MDVYVVVFVLECKKVFFEDVVWGWFLKFCFVFKVIFDEGFGRLVDESLEILNLLVKVGKGIVGFIDGVWFCWFVKGVCIVGVLV